MKDKKYTYDELNELKTSELVEIKNTELERISENEKKRQELIFNIILLQEKETFKD